MAVVRLTKTGGDSGVCVFGHLEKGKEIDVRVPERIAALGEQEAKIRARRMLQRDYPDENQMEWEAELVG